LPVYVVKTKDGYLLVVYLKRVALRLVVCLNVALHLADHVQDIDRVLARLNVFLKIFAKIIITDLSILTGLILSKK
jgi:hypothetical protein